MVRKYIHVHRIITVANRILPVSALLLSQFVGPFELNAIVITAAANVQVSRP